MTNATLMRRAIAAMRGPWGAALGGTLVLSLAVWSLQGAAADTGSAQAGSPFYERAVIGAKRGLLDHGDDGPAGPAAVCPDCGQVHGAAPAARAGGPGAPAEVCPDCGQAHPPAGAPPPPPADQGEYVYCEDCKTYHLRDEQPPATPPEHAPLPPR